MAFNQNNTASNNNANTTNQPNNDSWKAQGFLNLYLPTQDGKRKKLGAIPLKDSKPNEKQLLAWLNEDPNHVTILLSKLIVEYQSTAPVEGTAFAL